MAKREELLNVIEKKCETDLVSFVLQCRRESVSCLSDAISSCSKKQLSHIWELTIGLVMEKLTDISAEENIEDQDKLDLIQCLILMISATTSQTDVHLCDAMLQTAYLLKECLRAIPNNRENLKNSFAKLFEDWWHKNLYGRDHVINTTFIYLLEKSVDLKYKEMAAVVRRMWSLHEIIEIFDLRDERSCYLRELLKRCFICPQYIRHEHGIKFLAYTLCTDKEFTLSIHNVIKNHLVHIPQSFAKKYGEVYFKAWQQLYKDGDENLVEFEEKCIQDLIASALISQPTITPKLRQILGCFHGHKKQRGVDEMLCRLYEPLLWRHLKVPNYLVRENALRLFFDAFPVRNRELNKEDSQLLFQKQIDLFKDLMFDPNPTVRQASIIGVSQVLRQYWELFSEGCLKNIMKMFIQDLMYDTASKEVRESIAKGFTILLINPLSHLFLKPVLPKIQGLFHDVKETVRISMMELLIKVKKIRGIKYWEIVPLELLLTRLAHDEAPVRRRIVELLFDNFVPLNDSADELIERCIYLMETNHLAGRHFYRLAVNHMSLKETVEYIVTICKAILMAINKEWKTGREAGHTDETPRQAENDDSAIDTAVKDTRETGDDSGSEDDEDDYYAKLNVKNTSLMLRLLEVIYTLWTLKRDELNESSNKDLKKYLDQRLSCGLIEMDKIFMHKEIKSVVTLLMGYLPTGYVPGMNRSWISKLRNMTDTSEEEDFDAIVDSLCEIKSAPDVLELSLDWIKTEFEPTEPEAPSTGATKKTRKVRIMDPLQPQPLLGIKVMKFMFNNKKTCDIIFENHMHEVQEVMALLKKSMGRLQFYMESRETEKRQKEEEFQFTAFKLYTVLLLQIHQESIDLNEGSCSKLDELKEVFSWAQTEILPSWSNCENDSDTITGYKGEAIVETLLWLLQTIFHCGLADFELCTSGIDFCHVILSKDLRMTHLRQVIQSVYRNVEFVKYQEDRGFNQNMENILPPTLSKLFVSLSTFIKDHSETCGKTLQSVKPDMTDLIKLVCTSIPFTDSFTIKCMTTVLAAVLANMVFTSKQFDLEEESTLTKLPTLSRWILEIIQRVPTAMKCFLKTLTDHCCQSGEVELHRTHAMVHLLGTLHHCKCEKADLKQLHDVLTKTVDNLAIGMMVDGDDHNKDILMAITKKMEEAQKNCTELRA